MADRNMEDTEEEARHLAAIEAALDPQERNHLHQKWLDSPEFTKARGDWIAGPNARKPFEQSPEYRGQRYLFRKRTQNN